MPCFTGILSRHSLLPMSPEEIPGAKTQQIAPGRMITTASSVCQNNVETVTTAGPEPVACYQLRSPSFQYFVPAIVACRARPDSVIE